MKKLLILDLDETLLHACEHALGRPADFQAGPYHVYARPGLQAFLAVCDELFDVAVWTSSSAAYAAAVVARLFPPAMELRFVWSRERCTARFDAVSWEYCYLKDLKKVKKRGYRLEQVLVVDDTPAKLARQYGNLVRVAPYFGDPADRELPLLARYLPTLTGVENVRRVEKRQWREAVRSSAPAAADGAGA